MNMFSKEEAAITFTQQILDKQIRELEAIPVQVFQRVQPGDPDHKLIEVFLVKSLFCSLKNIMT